MVRVAEGVIVCVAVCGIGDGNGDPLGDGYSDVDGEGLPDVSVDALGDRLEEVDWLVEADGFGD